MTLRAMLAGVTAATLACAGGAWATQSGPAAPGPSSTVSGVTVTAPDKPSPLINPASQFVRERLPQSAYSEQYPRFRDAICVKVIGLPPEFGDFIAKRLIEVANEVRAPVAKDATCTPNVHIIFTPDPQAQIDDIARRKDILIGFHYFSQSKKITVLNRPIQAWYVTRTRDQAGQSWLEIANPCPITAGKGQAACAGRPSGRAGSRLSNDTSAEVVHSLILADANKVAGEKIDAVADYIAVLALAKWQGLEKCSAISTVLNLMAEDCADRPEAVTNTDLALLSALYAVDPREVGSQQRASIAGGMAEGWPPHRK